MKVFIGGAWREITSGKAYIGGAWRTISSAKSYIGSNWETIANFTTGSGSITLALSPTQIGQRAQTATVTSSAVTATPSGGQVPYTYTWTKQGGDSISVVSPTSAVTTFRADNMAVDEERNATFRCTATDSLGSTDFEDIDVSLTRFERQDPENPDL